MEFLKKLFGGGRSASEESNATIYYIKGKKCGAITRLRIDMRNDLSLDDNDNYYVRKVAVDNQCYGQVEIELWFDSNRREINRQINGGELVSKEEWEQWQAKQAEPKA